MIVFTLTSHSTQVLPADLTRWAAPLNKQANQDFAAAWGTSGFVRTPLGSRTAGIQVPVFIEDASDVQGALGYHDIDSNGVPYIKVFTRDSASAGVSLSSVISHEILEVLGDPFVDSCVTIEDGKGGATIYAAEVCDPVQADIYTINGVEVSNFVLPSWFGGPGSKYDHLGKLTAPFTMTSGGYFSFMQVTEQAGGWQQKQGAEARPWERPHKVPTWDKAARIGFRLLCTFPRGVTPIQIEAGIWSEPESA